MANERLRSTLALAGHTYETLAEAVGVDPKTVERWVQVERVPQPTHRRAAASVLARDEAFLWPSLVTDPRAVAARAAEVVQVYPTRGAVPTDTWRALVENTQEELDVLVYAGLFFVDYDPSMAQLLRTKGREGVRIRIALGDPNCAAVRQRGEDEAAIGQDIAGRIRLTRTYLADLEGAPGIEVRSHETTLYNSIYRGDSTMFVNMHVYGSAARTNPVMHLQRVAPDGLFDTYCNSFDRVWERSRSDGLKGGQGMTHDAR